jgi:Zn-finger nucleic acid-binding protein
MPELSTRYPCPVCLGVTMDTLRIGEGDSVLEIDHCTRCGGAWFDAGEAERLHTYPSAALWARISRRGDDVVTPCHRCHAPIDRAAEKCEACGWKNLLDCPVCERLMIRREFGDVHVDVCRSCKGVWFDHSELDTIWKAKEIVIRRRQGIGAGDIAGNVALDMLWFGPDIAVHAVAGAAHAAAHVPGMLAAAPEAAVTVVSAAGDAAGGIFDAIAGILEALFGLFDG